MLPLLAAPFETIAEPDIYFEAGGLGIFGLEIACGPAFATGYLTFGFDY